MLFFAQKMMFNENKKGFLFQENLFLGEVWDSNPRPLVPQTSALTN